MSLRTEIVMDAPYGSLTLHNAADTPAVYLTGGIGVTPARSIVLQAGHDKRPQKITLFYSNKTPADAAFLDELTEAQKTNPNFKLVATMTHLDGADASWKGQRGLINEEMIQKSVPHLVGPIYYLSGPPAMVEAMRRLLNKAGVDDDNIRSEEFAGY